MERDRSASWHTVHAVSPGQAFPLFDPTHNDTTIRYTDNGTFGGMAARIRLQTRLFDSLNISLVAAPYALQRAAVLAPFDRRQGYPLDQEDFFLRSRYKKIASMKHALAEIVEGLSIVAFTAREDSFLYNRMHSFQESAEPFLSEKASLLKCLFLTLSFPDGSSFTSRAITNANQLTVLFQTFFPTDTGPLPVEKPLPAELRHLHIEEGFRLLLPFDAQKVQAIRGKFLLLPNMAD